MVINDFDVIYVGIFKAKTYAPLIVYTNAPRAFAVAFQLLQSIVWRYPQIVHFDCPIEHGQLSQGNRLNIHKSGNAPSFK